MHRQCSLSKTQLYLPAVQSVDEFKWTSKYLKTNEKLRECVNTLLELAYLPPHKSLHAGKVHISISVECDHDRITSLIGNSSDHLRNRYQVSQPARGNKQDWCCAKWNKQVTKVLHKKQSQELQGMVSRLRLCIRHADAVEALPM